MPRQRTLTLNGVSATCTITPAIMQDATGKVGFEFPSRREEIVELTLRHLAVQQAAGLGTFNHPKSGIRTVRGGGGRPILSEIVWTMFPSSEVGQEIIEGNSNMLKFKNGS